MRLSIALSKLLEQQQRETAAAADAQLRQDMFVAAGAALILARHHSDAEQGGRVAVALRATGSVDR